QARLDVKGRVNALLVSGPRGDLQQDLHAHLDFDDWGLVLRDPASRARDLVRKLDPRVRDGTLAKARWQGRVPEQLALRPEPVDRLTEDELIAYYRKQHGYTSLESRQLLLDDF